jgi:hypothetical protein
MYHIVYVDSMPQRVKPLIPTTSSINEMEYNVEAMKIVPTPHTTAKSSSSSPPKHLDAEEKQR